MPVLPRLDYLSVPVREPLHCMAMRYRVLNAYPWNWRIEQPIEQGARLLQLLPSARLRMQPPHSAGGHVGARRVSYHKVPAVMQNILDATLIVRTWRIAGTEIAGNGIVPFSPECIPYRS